MKVIAGIIENRNFVKLYGPFDNHGLALCFLAHKFNCAADTKVLTNGGIVFAHINKEGKVDHYYDACYWYETWDEYLEHHSLFGCTGGDSLTTWVHELDMWAQNNGGKFVVTKEFANAWSHLPWNG